MKLVRNVYLNLNITALAGVAQWIEHQPVNQRAACSIPSQGTCLDCGPGSPVVCVGGGEAGT